ncbi:DNA polymerase II [Candidatus Woesearchaeota archaeon]|nr:DNA polymerase II [Candidatus Woesearchaeota archaeon]
MSQKQECEGFIINSVYKIENKESFVYCYGRLKNKKSFCFKKRIKPYFYVKLKDKEKINKFLSVEFEETQLKSFSEELLVKVLFDNQSDLNDSKKLLDKEGFVSYEADIKPEYRFLMDNDLLGSVFISGDVSKSDLLVDSFFEEPIISKGSWIPGFEDLKILAIDIETSMDSEKLYCVSLVQNTGEEEVLIVGKKGLKKSTCCESEIDLLNTLKERILKIDPDVITGWNLIDFDLKILSDKSKKGLFISRNEEEVRLRITDSFMTDSKAECEGRVILDGIHLLKTSFVRLDDYKLGTAAKSFSDSYKLIGDENKGEEIEESYKSNPQKLVDYNLMDSKLVLDILKNSGTMELTILRSKLTGMPLDRVRASIASFDSLYIRNLHERGFVGPNMKYFNREERTTGGFVMNSEPGIYDYVLVCDFKSLYPSIMRTFNIDPLMFVPDCSKKDLIKAPNGACFKREQGILPLILEDLWSEREKARLRNDSLTRQAIKILMNSMYGVLASPNCRFYSTDMANAITHFGHLLLKKTKEILEEKGYKVIYGDTDSVFISVKDTTNEDAKITGEEIQRFVNDFFTKYLKDNYGVESKIEMEFEKTFKKFFLPRVRGSEEGAKKRYAGLLISKSEEKIDFTGLEFVRRDWTEVSKKFQLELLEKTFKEENPEEYIKTFVNDLKKGKYDSLLVYRKALRKDVDEYTKTTPPHVKAAKLLDKITSNIIDYVITVEGPEPVQKQKNKIDYEHYIDKQIKPLADSILCFYETSFDEVIAGSQQKTLGGW